MKKFFLLFAAVFALAVTSCDTKKEKQQAADSSAATIDSLRQALEQTKGESSDLLETLAQIQQGFDEINEAQGRVSVENNEGSNREAIMENMAYIQRTLKLNSELIANLKQQLRTSSRTSSEQKKKLEEMIENFQQQLEAKTAEIEQLKEELAKRDIQIAEQGEQISNLNDNVQTLSSENETKARKVAEQDKELNTAWYVFGTKKELREQRILKSGDVLKSNDFNKDYFTRIDIRVKKTINLYSKSAKLMTNHPEGSYVLERDAQNQYTLRITDVQSFWSVSKYLVILVK